MLLHQGGAHGGLSRLALRGGREGHVLLEVVLDLLLDLDETLAVLALLVREETLPSLVSELQLLADILGQPDQRIVAEGLLVVLDLDVLEHGHDLGLLMGGQELLLPRDLLSPGLGLLLSCVHLYYRQV